MKQQIYQKLHTLLPSMGNIREGNAWKLKASGFMDLNIDMLADNREAVEPHFIVALSHYYRHESGDMIPDPDMVVKVWTERQEAEALTYQDLYRFDEVYSSDTGQADPKLQRSLNEFLSQWLDNLLLQGHK